MDQSYISSKFFKSSFFSMILYFICQNLFFFFCNNHLQFLLNRFYISLYILHRLTRILFCEIENITILRSRLQTRLSVSGGWVTFCKRATQNVNVQMPCELHDALYGTMLGTRTRRIANGNEQMAMIINQTSTPLLWRP